MTPFPNMAPSAGPANEEASLVRQMPANIEAEQALLGAILTNNAVMERVGDFLLPDHFYHPAHRTIYESAAKLIAQNHLANPVTLKPYMDREPVLKAVGGAAYLIDLVASVVTIINAEDYARAIQDLALRRSLIDLGEGMVNEAYAVTLEDDAATQIEAAERRLFDMATTGGADQGPVTFRKAIISAIDMAQAAHRREGALAGVPTDLIDLDKKLGGLHNSDLLILAGRPSMGKTALATTVAFNAARSFREEARDGTPPKSVVFFSLEMSAEQLATRILAEQAEVSSHKMRTGELSNEDFERVSHVSTSLESMPLFIDDTPALSISAMRTRCRRLARRNGGLESSLGLIVVDYLQLLQANKGERHDGRVQEVSAITRSLKALAKEMNVPVLALSQLSRAVEQRDDKRPQLSDLRESGSIEQDSDVVMFVYREQYYLERAEPVRKAEEADDKFALRYTGWKQRCEEAYNKAEVIIAKQRHGPIGTVRLFFDGNFTRFDNLQGGDPPPDF